MQPKINSLAPGLDLLPALKPPNKTLFFHQIIVLVITFLAYSSFHASRKPPSIVKSVLGPTTVSNDSKLESLNSNSSLLDTGWAPFDGPEGTHRLGEIDLAFLASYSIGMYFAGHIGDRIDLRLFLVFGMVGSGVLTIVFGLGYWFDVHFLGYFVVVQILCGLFQSIGWPCVVAVMGNWFGKDKRGLIMGVWNSHTSVGNIIGSVVASEVLQFGWGWSFVLPGVLVIVVGILVYMFLIVTPRDVGFESLEKDVESEVKRDNMVNLVKMESQTAGIVEMKNLEKVETETAGLLKMEEEEENVEPGLDNSVSSDAVGFLEAWRLPGVAPFAFCLFFSKLVAYTFLYWLPFYIRHTAVAGVHLSHGTAGILSTLFDVGGVLGGISAGYISDKIEARALTSLVFLLLSIPALILYRAYGSISMFTNVVLMFISGLLVNGPYALITTAVAADLGTQTEGNSRALATVTAIIDGTGSVGAALGPLLAGYISTRGWNGVFLMLILSIFFASLFLIRLAKAELKEKLNYGQTHSSISSGQ